MSHVYPMSGIFHLPIIETAKENGLNPYAYLNHLFEKLPNLESRDNAALDQLLPWNVKLQ